MKVDPKFIQFARLYSPGQVPANDTLPTAGGDDSAAAIPGDTLPERDFNAALARAGLMPLADVFSVTHDSPEANNPLAGKWAQESAALVHMWLYGEGKKYHQGFAQFVARSLREPVTEAMFKECFGLGYTAMLTRLRVYLMDTAYQYQEFEAGKGGGLPEPAPLEIRAATQPEIGRIKGETLVLAGQLEPAYEEMRAAYSRGPVDPALVASLGLLEIRRGEITRARQFLEAAARLQAPDPRANLELARLRYADAKASAGPAARINEAATRTALEPLLAARRQTPTLPEVYELLTEIWLHSAAPPAKADFAAINQGVVLFPRRPLLLYQAAELNRQFGDPREARLMAEAGLAMARTPEARQAFQEIRDALPPVKTK
ncbi:MAG: hypothetical protein WDM96_12410 [Lacunisphaera sp.]